MRENMGLYRGKTLDTGEWVTGFYVNCHGPGCKTNETRHYIVSYPGKWHEVYTSTVGEDTGLTDKNGKRIFEGDVVSGLFLYVLPINGVCAFRDGAFGLEWERGGAKEFTAFTSMCNVEFEVVGNVHDNLEPKGES